MIILHFRMTKILNELNKENKRLTSDLAMATADLKKERIRMKDGNGTTKEKITKEKVKN